MRRTLIIAKKELAWYFNTPAGYVLLGLFSASANFLAIRDIFLRGQADLSALFVFLPWLILVFIAAVSAKAIAEEKKGGTLEVLLALPVGKGELILGKFFGLGAFGLVAILTTLPILAIAAMLGNPDIGAATAGYLASFLLALSLLSIGIFISAASTNQVAAVFISIIVFFAVMAIGSPLIADQVPRVARSALFFISPISRYENMARGAVDLRDFVYFVSIMAGFLYLSIEMLKRNR